MEPDYPYPFALKCIDPKKGFDSRHPEIQTDNRQYLVRIDTKWAVGKFYQRMFGVVFLPYSSTILFPFETSWKDIYEILPLEDLSSLDTLVDNE